MNRWLLAVVIPLACAVQASQVLLEDSFTAAASDVWRKVGIFTPFSAIEYTVNGLVMKRNEKQQPIPKRLFDTAFELHSVTKTIPAGANYFDLSVKVGTNKADFMPKGYGADGYQNRIVWYDKDGKRIGEYPYKPLFSFSLEQPGWSSFRGAIPKDAVNAEVQFGFDTPDLGPHEGVILGGVKFTVGTKDEITSMDSLGGLDHRTTRVSPSPTEDGAAEVVIEIANTVTIDWSESAITLDDKPIGAELKRNGGTLTYTPATPLAKGLHLFKFTLKDKGGNSTRHCCPLYVGQARSADRAVVREDGMPILNGKPFFMLGIACLIKQGRNGNSYDKAFEEAAAAGLNFARHGSSFNMEWPDAEEYVAAARKHNMYISMPPTKVKNDIDVERIAKGVVAQIDVDRILAWDIGDDTSAWIAADDLMAKHNAIHAIDNTRLTTQADPVGISATGTTMLLKSNYTNYVKASDTFQPEIYPVGNYRDKETPEITAKSIPTVIKSMKQIHQDWKANGVSPRPIWPLIQYFYFAPGRSWNRMPTREELRAMSYLAVIHGSHGIFWYRYSGYPNTENAGRGFSDEQWKTFSSVSLEFRALYDMYCTLPVPQTQKVAVLSGPEKDALGFDSVNTLLKKHDGKSYLLVCNSAMADVKARFTVSGVTSVKEYFEKRGLTIADGTFEDAFGPFGVHVYVME